VPTAKNDTTVISDVGAALVADGVIDALRPRPATGSIEP
jgi:hypothetical protein